MFSAEAWREPLVEHIVDILANAPGRRGDRSFLSPFAAICPGPSIWATPLNVSLSSITPSAFSFPFAMDDLCLCFLSFPTIILSPGLYCPSTTAGSGGTMKASGFGCSFTRSGLPTFLYFFFLLWRFTRAATRAMSHATPMQVPEIVPAIIGVRAF